MATRLPTIKVITPTGFKSINESDFDPKIHKKYKGDPSVSKKKDSGETSGDDQVDEPVTEHASGEYVARETEAKGWWEVIHAPTQEVQNEKSLREKDAIALAEKLGAE